MKESDLQSLNLAELQAELTDLFQPVAKYYWLNLILASGLAYAGMAVASTVSLHWLLRGFGFVVCWLSFHRLIYFNHEILHLGNRLPGISMAYNFLVGFFIKFPTYIYESHAYHHQKTTYGTRRDPEYANVHGQWYPVLVLPFVLFPVVPLFLFIRWAILPPLLPFIGKVGRNFVFQSLSTFAILPTYKRPSASEEDKKKWYFQDSMCFVYWWVFIGLALSGTIPMQALGVFAFTSGGVFALNHWRAMVAHEYNTGFESVDFANQLASTYTVTSSVWSEIIWAPTNMGYHCVHHMFPKLPFHNLPKAHDCLMKIVKEDHPYRKHVYDTYAKALRKNLSV